MALGISALSESPLSTLSGTSAVVAVTGQALTATLGVEVISGSATVVQTGLNVNSALGNETVNVDFTAVVTGQELTSALGTAVAPNEDVSVTGLQSDFSLGTILGTGSVAITLTGQAATAAVGA